MRKISLEDLKKEYLDRGELVNYQTADTLSEFLLGKELLIAGFKVFPQHKIGDYRFDYKLRDYPILIELDGGVHNEVEVRQKDYRKDRYALARGFRVVRFSNDEVNSFEGRKKCAQETREIARLIQHSPKEVEVYSVGIVEQIKHWLGLKKIEGLK